MLADYYSAHTRNGYRWFSRDVIAAMLVDENKRFLISSFCSSTNNLTTRFHVAVCLFSNRSQMTSKCGKNNKVAHEAIAECVTDVLTPF